MDDRARLARTYHELKDELLTVCVHLTGQHAAGEDLVHDVFVAFARRRIELPSREETKRYLVKSCVHRARDLKRRRASGAIESDGDALARAPDRSLSGGEPLPRAAAAEESERVRAALRELPDEQREVVTLHLHGGLKFREIAESLEIPLDTATSRYRYALEKVRRRLAASDAPQKSAARKGVTS